MSSPAKPRPTTAPVVVTANRLRDGRVVWLAVGDRWSDNLSDARVFAPTEADAAIALGRQGEAAQLVVGAYLVDVVLHGRLPQPIKFRERLRLRGPSVDAEPSSALPLVS